MAEEKTYTQNFVDFHKCVNAKGEEFAPCQQFKRAYLSLCPNEWSNKWNDQVENGTFPASLEP
ncbi:Cytochrome c oxidase subunit 6B [Vanrija pseudolonga]|uniref:Cytochrome c oxidase subunit 6B n=1 Tax=Vanrija pseudolonga TaxID=143232 RepID=A0AAF0Y1U7_9TREE|nr:Cytochrome c oxidase subunit 6B [Vanrija pseudolonga]